MTDTLLFILGVQTIFLMIGLLFLFQVRGIIIPHSVWLSFLIRNILWLVIVVDQAAQLSRHESFPIEMTIIITTVIISLFLFSIVMRYQAHRQKLLLNSHLLEVEQSLEKLRHADETKHSHNWDHLVRFGFDTQPNIYHVEVKR